MGTLPVSVEPVKRGSRVADEGCLQSRRRSLTIPAAPTRSNTSSSLAPNSPSLSPHPLKNPFRSSGRTRRYPYKGILDSLANRAFARGTNAWTDTSHTAYTITTAGEDGFLRLLPGTSALGVFSRGKMLTRPA